MSEQSNYQYQNSQAAPQQTQVQQTQQAQYQQYYQQQAQYQQPQQTQYQQQYYQQTQAQQYQQYYQQPQAAAPVAQGKWNWGAFFYNIVFGVGCHAGLCWLMLIPVFNVVWIFVCGAKGEQWAWDSGKFGSEIEWRAAMKTWNRAGILQLILVAISIVLSIVFAASLAALAESLMYSFMY